MKFLIVLSFLVLLLSGCGNRNNSENNSSNSETSRTSVAEEFNVDTSKKEPIEEELSSYSTKILITEENRQNNVQTACDELNGTTVNSGKTFSFTGTMGPATPEKGYEKADTFEGDGDIVKNYGGGKCQISSTLYNAVLKLDGLKVIERHEHSRDVDYVPEGKDAAVSYGSVDFKFKNNYDFPIKIYASTNGKKITTKIVKLSYE